MAGQPTVTSSLSSSPASSTQHDTAAQDLRAQLQAATRQIHKLKREKAWELKQLQDNHQKQLSVALKDQKCTLHKEKQKDWEHQKETLMKRHEVEMQKSLKVRDAELAKLRSTVKHLQDELKESIQKNMSVVARGTFENEKGQLVAEVRDLRNQRRELESRLAGAQEEVNHKLNEIVQLKDTHSKQLEKQKRDASLEVRRLVSTEINQIAREVTVVNINWETHCETEMTNCDLTDLFTKEINTSVANPPLIFNGS